MAATEAVKAAIQAVTETAVPTEISSEYKKQETRQEDIHWSNQHLIGKQKISTLNS